MDIILEFLPFLIPLFLIQVGLVLFAVIDIVKKKQTKTLPFLACLILLWSWRMLPIMKTFHCREERCC